MLKSLAPLLALATLSVALKTIPNPPKSEAYTSGAVHESWMGIKMSQLAKHRDEGKYKSTQYESIKEYTECVDGYAADYKCNNVDLYYFLTHEELGSATGEGSSSWGWTNDGKEYIIIAQADGAAFAEVTSEGKLDYLGRLPNTDGSEPSIWRELRVLNDLLIVGSEAVNHQVQIFNLKKLLEITDGEKPKTFDSVADLEALWDGLPIGRTHNIVVNPWENFAVAVGAAPRTHEYAAGLIFIDLEDPTTPVLAGVQPDDGYVHDAQCLPYKGPDEKYQGISICYAYNEDTLTIYDVTNKANATIISRTSYEGASYTHQGWVLDIEDQSYLLLDDEYDEYDGEGEAADGFPVTYIWDIKDLSSPKLTGFYKSKQYGIDHNQYVKDGTSYQSNYGAGLRLLDISSIPEDPSGGGVFEKGFFDIYPEDDENPALDFVGSWSSYGLFDSGFIVINSIERGAFVVKYTGQ